MYLMYGNFSLILGVLLSGLLHWDVFRVCYLAVTRLVDRCVHELLITPVDWLNFYQIVFTDGAVQVSSGMSKRVCGRNSSRPTVTVIYLSTGPVKPALHIGFTEYSLATAFLHFEAI